ncbi:unnamed protein product [Pleuronectes platessa]|uniref:Uncharacterized protein n=1 Tax=Pleuronectes platessa TaxID=8262 RepID=A0A9N7YYM3_PLEPL|nr:unnamed protein product [Pleuronectes platessa]
MAAGLKPLIQPQTSSCPADPCSRRRLLRAMGAHHSPRLSSLSPGHNSSHGKLFVQRPAGECVCPRLFHEVTETVWRRPGAAGLSPSSAAAAVTSPQALAAGHSEDNSPAQSPRDRSPSREPAGRRELCSNNSPARASPAHPEPQPERPGISNRITL